MNQLSKNLLCICMRNGIEIWVEAEKINRLIQLLSATKESKFLEFEGEVINTADITGVFRANTMQDLTRRKNGQWQCNRGKWHDRHEKCECPNPEIAAKSKEWNRRVAECGKCLNGYVNKGDTAGFCDCIKDLTR